MRLTRAQPRSEQVELSAMVERLVNALDPEEIYLFGSRARGDFAAESDYDFMVIVPDSGSQVLTQSEATRAARSEFPYATDVIVLSHTDFHKQKHLKASMPAAVLRDGKRLYVEPGYSSTQKEDCFESVVREQTPEGHDQVLIENTRNWLKLARQDLLSSDHLLLGADELLVSVMFHSQQAVEKAAKAFLTWRDQPFGKTHNLSELESYCSDHDSDLGQAIRKANWLSEWAVKGRYSLGLPEPARTMANDAVAAARHLYSEVLLRLPKEAWPE